MQHKTPLNETQEKGDTGAYLPTMCNPSNHKCPPLYPSRKPPTAERCGKQGSLRMHCRSQECWLPSPHGEMNSPFLEVGTRRWPTSKDKEVWSKCNIYKFYQYHVFWSPQTSQWIHALWFPEQQKSFSQKEIFFSFFLGLCCQALWACRFSARRNPPYVTLLHWFTSGRWLEDSNKPV